MRRALPMANLPLIALAAGIALTFEGAPGLASPAAIPLLSAIVMALAMVAVLRTPGSPIAHAVAPDGAAELDRRRSLRLALVAGVSVALLPLLGFTLVTLAFLLASCRMLGSGWNLAALIAVNTVCIVHLLFAVAFQVVLPEGSLWSGTRL